MPSRTRPARDNAVRPYRLLEMRQAELAERVGVSRQAIVVVESGGYVPSVYLVLALAEQLGTSVDTLFATTEAPRPTIDVWNEASAVGFQVVLWGVPLVAAASLWAVRTAALIPVGRAARP